MRKGHLPFLSRQSSPNQESLINCEGRFGVLTFKWYQFPIRVAMSQLKDICKSSQKVLDIRNFSTISKLQIAEEHVQIHLLYISLTRYSST